MCPLNGLQRMAFSRADYARPADLRRKTERLLITRIEGVCPYVRAFINEVINRQKSLRRCGDNCMRPDATGFDILMRRCSLPVFLMNVPSTWQSSLPRKALP